MMNYVYRIDSKRIHGLEALLFFFDMAHEKGYTVNEVFSIWGAAHRITIIRRTRRGYLNTIEDITDHRLEICQVGSRSISIH